LSRLKEVQQSVVLDASRRLDAANLSVAICGLMIEIDSARWKHVMNARNAEDSIAGQVTLKLRVANAICVRGAV
jgi:hypothetical protein